MHGVLTKRGRSPRTCDALEQFSHASIHRAVQLEATGHHHEAKQLLCDDGDAILVHVLESERTRQVLNANTLLKVATPTNHGILLLVRRYALPHQVWALARVCGIFRIDSVVPVRMASLQSVMCSFVDMFSSCVARAHGPA